MVPAGKLGGKIIAGVAKDAAKKAEQIHHFATNKSKKYTAALSKIAEKYGLDLDGAWNRASLPHAGRLPWFLRKWTHYLRFEGKTRTKPMFLKEKHGTVPVLFGNIDDLDVSGLDC